jgi:alpha-beta hydrolase superfamily lysophospholipase
MAKGHTEELVFVETEDGLPHEGLVIRPADREPLPIPLLWVHGLTSKFYSRPCVQIGRELATRGYTFVTGNNRGHDFGYPYRPSPDAAPRLYGGGWELLSEAPRDISAWLGFTVGLGFRGVALLGHSLGARKVAQYQAERQDERVLGLAIASPPMANFRPRPELLAQAKTLIAAGRGQDLLPWGISPAGAGTVSAASFHDRAQQHWDLFGLEDLEPPIARVRCPLLACYGTDEAWVGGARELEVIRQRATGATRVETHLFAGADHSYTGQHVAVAAVLADWLATLQ